MDWPVECPKCGEVFDSKDSYGDSRAMLRSHIENKHFPEDTPHVALIRLVTKQDADDITRWCNGVQVVEEDALDPSKTYVGINVTNLFGGYTFRASEGEYIVQMSNGEFRKGVPDEEENP